MRMCQSLFGQRLLFKRTFVVVETALNGLHRSLYNITGWIIIFFISLSMVLKTDIQLRNPVLSFFKAKRYFSEGVKMWWITRPQPLLESWWTEHQNDMSLVSGQSRSTLSITANYQTKSLMKQTNKKGGKIQWTETCGAKTACSWRI